MKDTPQRSVEEIVEEAKLLLKTPTYGDGHYCQCHPDDPAHTMECYEHPLIDWLYAIVTTERTAKRDYDWQAVMDTTVMLHEQDEMNDTAFCKLRDLLHAIALNPTPTTEDTTSIE